jgi:drug/metabolite transporter (DMT)-like permease
MSLLDPALLALLAAAALGAAIVSTKVGLRDMPVLAGATISIPTTTVLFWSLSPFWLNPGVWQPNAVSVFVAVGLFYPAVVTLLVFESNRRMGPTVASTVSSITPLVAVAAALVFLQESLSGPLALGIFAIAVGVTLLSWSRSGYRRGWPLWLLALPLAAAAFRGSAQTAIKFGLTLWPDPFAAGLIGYSVSSAVILLAVLLLKRRWPLRYHRRALPWFALSGLLNGLAVILMYEGLRQGSVTVVSPIVASYPIFTFLLSGLLLRDEQLTARVAMGVALTVAGVIVMAAR